jgi:hypothetical protein
VQYVLLIYGDEAADTERFERMSEEERNADMASWFGYTQALKDADVYVAGEALQPTETAKSVRVQNGSPVVTDGPFAETKEALGGFYIIDVGSQEEANDWAGKLPSASYAPVEVRPVMVFPDA